MTAWEIYSVSHLQKDRGQGEGILEKVLPDRIQSMNQGAYNLYYFKNLIKKFAIDYVLMRYLCYV